MTAEEIRKMTDEELKIEAERLRGRLFTLRSQSVTEKVDDVSQFRKLRKDVARILTEQSARRLKAAPARAPKGAAATGEGGKKKSGGRKAKAGATA